MFVGVDEGVRSQTGTTRGDKKRMSSARSQTSSHGGRAADPQSQSSDQPFETEMRSFGPEGETPWYEKDDTFAYFDKDDVHRVLDGKHLPWKQRLQSVFEGTPHRRDAVLHVVINVVSISAVFVSCVTFCIMTLPENIETRSGKGVEASGTLFWIDTACVALFFAEIALRSWAVGSKGLGALVDVFYFIDVVTIISFFVDLLLDLLSSGGQNGVAFVRLLRLFRVFRVFKLSRHSKSLQLVVIVLKKSASGLTVLTLPLLIVTLVFSSVIFFFEVLSLTWDPNTRSWRDADDKVGSFQSIPDAIWFTASTITTVGFGDTVPATAAGKVFAVLASFLGILILSFPNIVLGGNLQFAFRTYYRQRARAVLGAKFRRVLHVVRFVNEIKRLAEERAAAKEFDMPQDVACEIIAESSSAQLVASRGGDECGTSKPGKASLSLGVSASPSSSTKKNSTNFLATKQELDYFRRDDTPDITLDNIRTWTLGDVRAISVLRRLLEMCSGVGTVQELHSGFVAAGNPVRSTDIAVVALYLMHADFLQVFVFRRGATNMLLSLTNQACTELMVHTEEGGVDCIRSVDVAKLLWRRTTQTPPPFSLQLLMSSYVIWAATEKFVDNKLHTPHSDLKVTFWKAPDLLTAAQKQVSGLRRTSAVNYLTSGEVPNLSNLSMSAMPLTGSKVTLAEAKHLWKSVVAKQSEQIAFLEQQIAIAVNRNSTAPNTNTSFPAPFVSTS